MAGPAAAKPCKKLVVDKTDAFGQRVHGGVVYVDFGHYLAVGLREEGGKLLLQTMWVRNGVVESTAPAGTEVHVALEGGEVLTATTRQVFDPVSNANPATVFTQWMLDVEIDADTLSKLATFSS